MRGKGITAIQVHAPLCSVPSMRCHTGHLLSPSSENTVMCNVSAQGSPLETQCPRAGICLACTKVQTPRRETRVRIKCIVCTNSLGSGSEEVPGVQVSRCHLGPTLQVGLSKESSFRPGMLTLLHGVCVWRSEVEGGEERDYE